VLFDCVYGCVCVVIGVSCGVFDVDDVVGGCGGWSGNFVGFVVVGCVGVVDVDVGVCCCWCY